MTETQRLVVDRPAYLPRLVNLLEHAPARTLGERERERENLFLSM